jgi:photosystem II stability/assembly factor-like uncharacterized protein
MNQGGRLGAGKGVEVKEPVEITLDVEQPGGKALLRQIEFLDQRGLSREPVEVHLNERSDLEVGDERPPRGAAPPSAVGAVDDVVQAPSPYLLASREKEAMLAAAPPEPTLEWRPLGPAGIPQGQTYGVGPGATATMAGRVTAIAVDPAAPEHVLVGTAAGGVWQTRDGGQTWKPVTDYQPTLSIGALAFDPSHPSTVYAGTGEGNSQYSYLGQGILVSRDGGATWTLIARELFAGVGFYRLVVDPNNGDRLFAATTGAAAVSVHGGTRWSLLHPGMTWDVSLAYVGAELEVFLAAPDGLFAARGSGAFTPVDFHRVDLPGLPPLLDWKTERMAVTHVPSDPGQAFVFAAAQGRAHLWHRAAVDQPFVSVELPSFPIPAQPSLDVLGVGQAKYDWVLAVPPGSADIIYLGAIELVKGERAGQGSPQAGWPAVPTWSNISSRLQVGDSIHPDQHAIAFDSRDPNVVYVGNDGGIFRSPDAGGTWQSLNAGLAIAEVEYLTQQPDDPDWILAGLQDNGTIRWQAGQGWTQVALGDGGDCGTNMAHPDVCYHSYWGMSLERSSRRGDRGSWTPVTPPDSGRDQFRQLFYPPLEVNARVVVKAGEVVCVSSDSGTTWTKVALPPVALPEGRSGASIASALAIPTTDRVLVGTIWGDVFRIDRHPDHPEWTASPTKLTRPRDGWISDLLVDPDLPHRYWATFSRQGTPVDPVPKGAVFRSDDQGITWTDKTAGLPSSPVNAIVNDPSDSDRVWVACDVGVWESPDAGETWSVYGTGLPNALAVDLLFYEPDRLLRVGTRSRGVWEATVS